MLHKLRNHFPLYRNQGLTYNIKSELSLYPVMQNIYVYWN